MALRRRYPQIYSSSVKLQLDVSSITLGAGDFSKALQTIVPSSQRALAPSGRALDPALRPLLDHSLSLVLKSLLRVFPHAATQQTDRDNANGEDVSLGGGKAGLGVSCYRCYYYYFGPISGLFISYFVPPGSLIASNGRVVELIWPLNEP